MTKTIVTSIGGVLILFMLLVAAPAFADHSWGNYHWARTTNSFTLKFGDNVSSTWDAHLAVASIDWSTSLVLDTAIVLGQSNPKNCRASSGRVEVCNNRYGNNGWLGIASIWISGSHITQGTVKLNDTYFNTAKYNTLEWRQFVMCQEVGHTFGLDHQDEDFYNSNLGTCMDYTNDPARNDGFGDNQHPNQHDYDQLVTIYGGHTDGFTTLAASAFGKAASAAAAAMNTDNQSEWGKSIRTSPDGRSSLFERNLGNGNKIFTFVIWAD